MDTVRSVSPITFMSNMLYACSILYKTKLPFIVTMNKVGLGLYGIHDHVLLVLMLLVKVTFYRDGSTQLLQHPGYRLDVQWLELDSRQGQILLTYPQHIEWLCNLHCLLCNEYQRLFPQRLSGRVIMQTVCGTTPLLPHMYSYDAAYFSRVYQPMNVPAHWCHSCKPVKLRLGCFDVAFENHVCRVWATFLHEH